MEDGRVEGTLEGLGVVGTNDGDVDGPLVGSLDGEVVGQLVGFDVGTERGTVVGALEFRVVGVNVVALVEFETLVEMFKAVAAVVEFEMAVTFVELVQSIVGLLDGVAEGPGVGVGVEVELVRKLAVGRGDGQLVGAGDVISGILKR